MLNASQRVKLIAAIAPVLGRQDWSVIDLTLQQFKLPTINLWDGDRGSYIAHALRVADDEQLLGLAVHFEIEGTVGTPGAVLPSFWRSGYLRLFVTHLAVHKKDAALLQQELLPFRISCFIAHADIEPTKKWQDEIELALKTAECLLALLTVGFHESKWTDQEIGFALGKGVPVLSIRLGEDPYGFLAREQGIQGVGQTAESLARSIFSVFLRNQQTAKRMAECLTQGFASSNSWQAAKDNFTLLEQVEYWDQGLTAAVNAAVKENSEISEAFGVPDRVKAFLKKKTT